jgi:hypothetical protein
VTAPGAPGASVVAVLRGEPPARVEQMLGSVAAQVGVDRGIEVVLAAPEGDPARAAEIGPGGAVTSIRWVPNAGGGRSAGLNAAVAASSSPVIVRIDARASFAPGHVRRCIDLLEGRPDAIVGGAQVAVAPGAGPVEAGIARALRNPLLSGGAAYRSTGRSGPVDTVYLGAFRRATFDALGGYEVRLVGNEDFDLCQRAAASGREVWLDADLAVAYRPRSDLGALARQYFAFGTMKVDYWRLRQARPRPRQVVVPAAQLVGTLALGVLAARRPGAAVGVAAAAVAGVAALDHRSGPAGLRVRAASVAAAGTAAGAFGAGVWARLLGRRR